MKLQIDIKKIIKLLAKDIYDSPYALLRENLQNAYDAILMRKAVDQDFNPSIEIIADSEAISITDNGIGMTYDNVENNFWKAGASGKNNEAARKAGVVGTFGIGAMANFGVCKKLDITTRYIGSPETIKSSLNWDDLSYSEDCINTERIQEDDNAYGTTVTATLQEGVSISKEDAIRYLLPYIKYIQIPVRINGELISQHDYESELMISGANMISKKAQFNDDIFTYTVDLRFLPYNNGLLSICISNIVYKNTSVKGNIVLVQNSGNVMGLRNKFGLAPIPVASVFRWGGVVDLDNIVPTAGRDSVIRESIEFVGSLMRNIESNVVKIYSEFDVCDNNTNYLEYLYNNNLYSEEYLQNITIERKPFEDRVKLSEINSEMGGRNVRFYSGNDVSIINQFSNESNFLLLLSSNRIRRTIQQKYLNKIGIEPIPDNVTATIIPSSKLETSDYAISMRIEYVLENDYLLNNIHTYIAEVSHNQPNLVEKKGDGINVYIDYRCPSLTNLRRVYKEEYSLFESFIKDYVRQFLYNKLSMYVPSATREGAEALMRILKQKRDLYSIEEREIGEIDEILKDYLAGKASLLEVHRASSAAYNTQQQEVAVESIGQVEDVVPTICKEVNEEIPTDNNDLTAFPPILNLENETKLKLLKANEQYGGLNNNKMFLALSDKLFERYSDFFLEPHTTKVIWSTHKVVYIFTHISNQLSLYYDIDLNDMLPGELTGGKPIKTTTIMTKYKIFVPIISEMYQYFDSIHQKGHLEFYVRFDIMRANNH